MSARAEKAMQEAIANREPWHGDTVRGTPTTEAEREAYWTHIAAVNDARDARLARYSATTERRNARWGAV